MNRTICFVGTLIVTQNMLLLVLGFRIFSGWRDGDDVRAPGAALRGGAGPGGAGAAAGLGLDPTEARRLLEENRQLRARVEAAAAAQAALEAQAKVQLGPGAAAALPAVGELASGRRLTRDASLLAVPREELKLFGAQVPPSVRLCVGFSTVARKKDYVLDTVGSMLGLRGETKVSEEERASVVIVAHLADFDMEWVQRISQRLHMEYSGIISTGHFHAIHAPEDRYPLLEVCPPFCSYNDDAHRVKWRSKQNIDYALLMHYSVPLAPYYLQLEDDLSFANNWVLHILEFVDQKYPPNFRSKENAPWRLIDFSQLGFIGKLFQSDELSRMAQFLLLFYDQMPCDLLLGEWTHSMTQAKKIEYWKSYNSLFQHVGIFRSLGGYQPLQEQRFQKKLFDNPSAQVLWSMMIVPTFEGRFAYLPVGEPPVGRKPGCDFKQDPGSAKAKVKKCWFWAKMIQPDDHVTLVFRDPRKIKAVFVEFGNDRHPHDLLGNGALEVAGEAADPGGEQVAPGREPQPPQCGEFKHVMALQKERMYYWEENVSVPAAMPVPEARCLRIRSLTAQKEWVVISQIQVRTLD